MTMLGFGTYRGARRTRPPAAAAPPSELSPRDALIAAPATLAVWDTTEAASMTRPEGGHPSAPGDTIGTLANLKSAGTFSWTAASPSVAPQWQHGKIAFDGVDDDLRLQIPDLPRSDLHVIFLLKTDDAAGLLVYASTNTYLGAWEASPAANSSGSGTYYIDGTGFSSGSATRSQIKALVADGRFHRIGFQMAHGSTSQLPRIGGYGVQYCVQGVLIPICALQTTHSGFADALALAIAYCDERAAGLTE